MKKLRGVATSKRWWLTIRLAMLIVITGWGSMGVTLYFLMLDQFVTISLSTMGFLVGLVTGYNAAETYRPHYSGELEVTQTQQNVTVSPTINVSKQMVDDQDEPLPPKPWIEKTAPDA